ncbi:MAG: dTDP-4-dehydrorhamnose 3,5-epimerase family protein [Chitinophagaceae bacterium]|nr:dTDP-4-dehydrorhamnose 3,5-epimerase family protein [Chitinophagaceae bacterium]MBP6478126.1 dTDP-4-dehydrorhamnose 3,5-epimerase family protein [Chitinophagaceae bacterium]MBP7279131.1 dTDP-4-dehydrorhamnose 3,5-epimerase family protein [Sedimentibacter sp.]HQZ78830.1 dTDP-4-dehydrorhamnose 3,5-epimerase family protein [Bacteroidia bacterium]
MIRFVEQNIQGVFLVENFTAQDSRGVFVKTLSVDKLQQNGFTSPFSESYYSKSFKNVIRGMHFQTPPFEHDKLVYVTEGAILDVILDIRTSSITYGECLSFNLSSFGSSVLIPKGCAHGFLTLSDTATVVYNVTTEYEPSADKGILWDSFGFNWGIESPIISERDKGFPNFKETHFF